MRRPAGATLGDDERGSVLLLTLGYALLAIALVLVCVEATGLSLAQKRVDAAADAAALAAADAFVLEVRDGRPVAVLTTAAVQREAVLFLETLGTDAVVVDAGTPDGVSARVTVRAAWRPLVGAMFVADGLVLESTATSRTALR